MEANLRRMIQLADECFDTRHDPAQLSVDEAVMEGLRRLHPQAIAEARNQDGPIAWTLVIPTTRTLMEGFLEGRLSERELFAATPEGVAYDAVYLCSALVLPEHRRHGIALRLICDSLLTIRSTHPVQALFFWGFSEEGECLAQAVAKEMDLPLFQKRVDPGAR